MKWTGAWLCKGGWSLSRRFLVIQVRSRQTARPTTIITHRYLYVLAVEDPAAPKELGRYVYEQRNVISSTWIARPAKCDSIVVMLDGTWEGVLHILDVSNPSNIVKLAEFDTATNVGMVTNIAVKK